METPYDWITVAIFAGLVVIFLQRSVGDTPHDSILSYLPAALGCAVINWLGNGGHDLLAILGLAALAAYIWFIIRPLENFKH